MSPEGHELLPRRSRRPSECRYGPTFPRSVARLKSSGAQQGQRSWPQEPRATVGTGGGPFEQGLNARPIRPPEYCMQAPCLFGDQPDYRQPETPAVSMATSPALESPALRRVHDACGPRKRKDTCQEASPSRVEVEYIGSLVCHDRPDSQQLLESSGREGTRRNWSVDLAGKLNTRESSNTNSGKSSS